MLTLLRAGMPFSSPGWKPLMAVLLTVVGLLAPAWAATFATPVTSGLVDAAAYSVYVDGSTTAMSGSATDILWTQDSSTGSSAKTFGDTLNPGARHLRIGFNQTVDLGTLLVDGNVSVSVLKPTATYPGNLNDENDWIAAERLDGTTKMTGHYRLGQLNAWVLPVVTATRAIRLTHTALRSDHSYKGTVGGVHALATRLANVAPQGRAWASANVASSSAANNLSTGGWSVTSSAAITEQHDEWLMLVWPVDVTVSGLGLVVPNCGQVQVEKYMGASSTHPRDAADSAWTPVTVNRAVPYNASCLLPIAWVDFGQVVTTNALRVRFTAPVTPGGTTVGVGELLALDALGTDDLSTAALSVSKTNAAIPITFTLAQAGYVTLAIDDSTGKRVRNLVSETYFPAGTNTIYWDGMNEHTKVNEEGYFGSYTVTGRPVAPGTYTVTGLVRDAVTPIFEFGIHNTGNPPWQTNEYFAGWHLPQGRGGWLSDHGTANDVAFIPHAGEMAISSPFAENGNQLIWADLNGNKTWGLVHLGWIYDGHSTSNVAADAGASRDTSVMMYFGGADECVVTATPDTVELWKAPDHDGPYTNFAQFTLAPPEGHSVRLEGLAVHNTLLVATVRFFDSTGAPTTTGKLLFIDAINGTLLNTVDLADVRGTAFESSGHLLALSGTSLTHYVLGPKQQGMTLPPPTTLVSGLDDPRDLAVDSSGNIYVSVHGSSHQVNVFTSGGVFVRAIGAGGRNQVGQAYDANKMEYPMGVAISNDNGTERLWVAEASTSPRNRVSIWSLTGTLIASKFGPVQFGGGGNIDPADKTKAYFTHHGGDWGMAFDLNWTTGASAPAAIISPSSSFSAWIPDEYGRVNMGTTPLHAGGYTYLTNTISGGLAGMPRVAGLWQLSNNTARPVAAVGDARGWSVVKDAAFSSRWPSGKNPNTDPLVVAWSDSDYDGVVDPEEATFFSEDAKYVIIGDDLTASFVGAIDKKVYALAYSSINGNGVPLYNLANMTTLATNVDLQDPYACNRAVIKAANNRVIVTGGPLQGFVNGALAWTYHSLYPSVDMSYHYAPIPQAGEIIGVIKSCGSPVTPPSGEAGEIFALNGECGQVYQSRPLPPTLAPAPSALRRPGEGVGPPGDDPLLRVEQLGVRRFCRDGHCRRRHAATGSGADGPRVSQRALW